MGVANWSQRPRMFLFVSEKDPGGRESFTSVSRRRARVQPVTPPPDQQKLFVLVWTARESNSAVNAPAVADLGKEGVGGGCRFPKRDLGKREKIAVIQIHK